MEKNWRIWYETYDEKGNCTGRGASVKGYQRRGNAIRAAKGWLDNLNVETKWMISRENPFINYEKEK